MTDRPEATKDSTKVLGSISGTRSVSGTMEELTAKGSFEPSDSSDQQDEDIKMATAMALAIQNNPNLTPEEIHELLGQQQPIKAATPAAGAKPATNTSQQFRLGSIFAGMDDVNSSSSHNRTAPRLQGLADRARGRLQDMLHTTSSKDQALDEGSERTTGSAAASRTVLGMAWKRRGGLAKYTAGWERRYFCLYGHRLVYFADETDTATSRGTIDLENHVVCITSGHSGAPTPFSLSIKNAHGETKWKMCCDSQSMQLSWLIQLSNITIRNSVEAYNTNLKTADPSILDYTMYYPSENGIASTEKSSSLWELDTNGITSSTAIVDRGTDANCQQEVTVWTEEDHVEARAAVLQAAPSVSVIHSVRHVYMLWNIGVIIARAIVPELFWYILIAGNVFLHHLVEKSVEWQSLVAHIYKAPVEPTIVVEVGEDAPDRYVPVAGSSAIELENTDDDPVNAAGEHFAGWRKVPGNLLKVRAHGYSATKEKIPSPGELYDCVAVDVFESPQRYPDMAPRVQLPKAEDDAGVKTWRSPDLFIISIALPTDPPKMGKSSSDGGGYTVTMYYKLKECTRALLRRLTSEDDDGPDLNDPRMNAVRLWEEWIRRAPTDPKFMARFKVVPLAHNLAEIGMPGWISKYNGKPFLIKRAGVTGFMHTHPHLSCVEFDISLHPFPYLAKQAICFMKDSYFKKVLVTFGFVIEGRSDDELPETVIGCMQLCYPDPQYAIQAKDFFSGKAPRSFTPPDNEAEDDGTNQLTETTQ